VEAKSRQWSGVKGFKGGREYKFGDKLNMRNIVASAYKRLNIPLYVIIDVNLPPANIEQQKIWFQELDETMNDLANEGYCNPCPAHGVFFHNDPSHYAERLISNDTDHLWIKHYVDKSPSPLKQYPANIIERIMTAHHQRAIPPEAIPE
jgi:hypothetical protein